MFDDATRPAYVRSLHRVCRPGALVHVLALSDAEPGIGPRIADSVVRDAFGAGWELEDLRSSRYRVMIDEQAGVDLGLPAGRPADMVAWLARARRL